MNLFMLTQHDLDRTRTCELLEAEIDAVTGGDGQSATFGELPDCESTMCNCMVVTPGGDGEPMMDCDGG
ncbi:hypothetical protein ACWCOP_14195 [Maricaulaceae bacterium MS644]